MNEHPHELLAEYLDGELPPARRSEVEAHLASCPTCADEVALAREAREALGALPEVPAPTGLALDLRRRARRPPRAGRWIAAAAAAAVLVGAGAVVVLRQAGVQTQGDAGAQGGGAGPAAGPMAPETAERQDGEDLALGEEAADPSSVVYVVTDRDYDPAALARLAPRLRTEAEASLRRGFPETTDRFFSELSLEAVSGPARRAIRCASQGLPPDQPAAPFRIEAARFQGEPVYVAAFLRGPDPSARHDRVLIWVVTREACLLRYFASQDL
jgi:Putative zinc-finger